MKRTVLIIEDEVDVLEIVERNLEGGGYRILKCLDGETGLICAHERKPDLVLLDLNLPGLDGMDVCRRLKSDIATRSTPIIILTARSGESDVVEGLRNGADDYITKPFRTAELVARVDAILRRFDRSDVSPPEDSRIERDNVVIDATRHEVRIDGTAIDLTVTQFRILSVLVDSCGKVLTRERIASRALGELHRSGDRNIDVHVKMIRKRLGDYRDMLETVRGVGYRFSDGSRVTRSG